MSHRRALGFAAIVCCPFVAGCGGSDQRFGPAQGEAAAPPARSGDSSAFAVTPAASGTAGEGTLVITAGGSVESYLGSARAVVRDSEGTVVGGGEQDFDSGDARASVLELALLLPAGKGYTLSLSAQSADPEPSTCLASIGPFQIDGGALAKVQVLAWDCGETIGYLPSSGESDDCFWLGDWSFISRSAAPVGEDISVGAAGHGAEGKPASFDWSTASPGLGRFAAPHAAETSFRCQSPGEQQPLIVTIRDGACRRQLSHTVSCL